MNPTPDVVAGNRREKITVEAIRGMKARGQKIPALTAYDYPTTRILDEAGVPLLLVGDSLGMVVLGYPDTTHVTMDEMEHHVRALLGIRCNGCFDECRGLTTVLFG